MATKQPKHMISKYDGSCDTCGRHIDAGEPIYWKARGQVDCNDCTQLVPEVSAPITAANREASQAAGDWSKALAWDESIPEPGESIGQIENGNVIELVKPVQASNVNKLSATAQDLRDLADDDQLADIGAKIIEQAADSEPDFSQSERAEALTSELLIVVVNAIDVAGIAGRHALRSFCNELAKGAIQDSTRQHLWAGIAEAINKA